MSVEWTHLPPDDLEGMIKHAKVNGYIDHHNTIRVDFDDFCNLLRKLKDQSDRLKKLDPVNDKG